MSAANAAARKRRAAPDSAPSVISRSPQFGAQSATPAQSANPNVGLTIQQVIALVDTRLIKLEKFMKDTTENNTSSITSPDIVTNVNQPNNRELEITNNDIVFQEVDRRFEILAVEINNLKDMLLKLQTYTMEVNKTLMEERIQVFSDLGAIKAPTTSDTDSIFLTQDETEVNSSSIDLRNLANEELFNK